LEQFPEVGRALTKARCRRPPVEQPGEVDVAFLRHDGEKRRQLRVT
jgi:hypothetical protein